MTKERLEWVLLGLNLQKLAKSEKKFVESLRLKPVEKISKFEEMVLEKIYRAKSR